MKKYPLIGIVICVLILLPTLSLPVAAKSDAKLFTSICGGIPLISRTFLVIGVVDNIGDNHVYNVSYIFSITGGYAGKINVTQTGNESKMDPWESMNIDNHAFGFGPVLITLTVSASNFSTTTKTAKGFQIGGHTFVSFTLIRLSMTYLVEMIFLWSHWNQNY